MKKHVYSSRLDHIYKTITKSQTTETELKKFKNTINSVDGELVKLQQKSISNFSIHSSFLILFIIFLSIIYLTILLIILFLI